MRIVQIVAGSGGTFYCENCLRDAVLARALAGRGHDTLLVPLYLPVFADDPAVARSGPVFFGGINTYLQQKLPIFRRTPRWLDRLFDARWLLKLAAKRAGAVSAEGMGEMTLSMIKGESGNQAKELERLVTWLGERPEPDVIHITNVMLIGAARRLKEELGVPIVCVLQDEGTWLDGLDGEYGELCWDAIRERVVDIDLFVSVSGQYARTMQGRLAVGADRIRTVHVGLDLSEYARAPLTFDPPVIGYLSRMTPSHGLGDLVDAFIALKRGGKFAGLKLKAIGGMVGPDRRFVRELETRLATENMDGDAEFIPVLDRDARSSFLQSLSVMSVPLRIGGAFGTFMIEAWASGVPVVQPDIGAFRELVELAGGGVIYEPGAPGALAGALESVLSEPNAARQLGRAGRVAAETHFGIDLMADSMLGIYRSLLH